MPSGEHRPPSPRRAKEAAAVLEALPRVGVDYEDVMSTLERDGVQEFADSWNDLLVNLQTALCAESEHRPHAIEIITAPDPGSPPDC
jgi:hypothetical protein